VWGEGGKFAEVSRGKVQNSTHKSSSERVAVVTGRCRVYYTPCNARERVALALRACCVICGVVRALSQEVCVYVYAVARENMKEERTRGSERKFIEKFSGSLSCN
jgi:hypothetical protein